MREGERLSRLQEDNRRELIAKSKSSVKGHQRFNRRNKSRIHNTVKAMNSIDMNKLFKDDILTVNIPVKGETDEYIVRITFGGFLEILRDQIDSSGELSFREVSRAAIIGFNKDDVYINCTCPDWKYRFAYFATRNQLNSGTPETRPSNITNPDDSLGSACKHVLLVLNNTSWIVRVSRVIVNYIKYMERHYSKLYVDIIYPAIYGKEYTEPVQLTLDDVEDNSELSTGTDTLDTANEYNKNRTRFQPGNKLGNKFKSKDTGVDDKQMSFDDYNEDDEL